MWFGLQTLQFNVTWEQIHETWRLLDRETHFKSVWVMDHLIPPVGEKIARLPCFEAWTLLGAAARATVRLGIGSLVTANTFRHPALLAKMATTVDHISGGRLTVGLGAGWLEAEHRAFGIELGSLRARLDALEDTARLLRLALAGGSSIEHAARGHRIEGAPFLPGPAGAAPAPIMIGGGGERRTLRIAAEHGDSVNLIGPVSRVRHKLQVLEAHCDAVGRDYERIEKTVHIPVAIVEDPQQLEAVRVFLAGHYEMTPDVTAREIPVGVTAHVLDVLERYAALGVSGVILPSPGPWSRDDLLALDAGIVRPMAEA